MPFHSWTRRSGGETELRCWGFPPVFFCGAAWRDWREPSKTTQRGLRLKNTYVLYNMNRKWIIYLYVKMFHMSNIKKLSDLVRKKCKMWDDVRVLGLYLLDDWNILCSIWLRAFSSKHSLSCRCVWILKSVVFSTFLWSMRLCKFGMIIPLRAKNHTFLCFVVVCLCMTYIFLSMFT